MIRKYLLLLLLSLATLFLGSYALPPNPEPTLIAKVINVIDGDTIDVKFSDEREERVRYIGMDTPEIHGQVQCFGQEASAYNKCLVGDKTVWLELDVQERDQYGRLLAYVYLDPKGYAMVNAILLAQGYAQIATFPPNVRYVEVFEQLQKDAREAGRGFWCACFGICPTKPAPEGVKVIINEFELNPPGEDAGSEWVELYNLTAESIDIKGWRLSTTHGKTITLTISGNTIIPANGYTEVRT